MYKVVVVRRIVPRIDRRKLRLAASLTTTVTLVVSLIVLTIIGVFICYSIEDVMQDIGNFTSSSWYTIYTDFVNTVQHAFPLLAVVVLVMIAVFIIAYVLKAFGGT